MTTKDHLMTAAPDQIERCWLCGFPGDVTSTILTNRETPGGKPCKTKPVRVHLGCYMDMDS